MRKKKYRRIIWSWIWSEKMGNGGMQRDTPNAWRFYFILFYLFVLFYLVSQSLRFWSNNFDQQVKRQPCNDTYRTTLDFVVETWYWFIRETTCRTMKTPVHFTCPIWRKYYSLLENSFKHISRRSPGQDFFIAPALKQILF